MPTNTKSGKAQEILGDAEFNKKWELENLYSVIRKSNDPRFGEITLMKSKNSNELIFVKEKLVTSKQQASNDIRELKSRMSLNHNSLHKLIGYSTKVQKELCSTNYLIKVYYQFPKSDLQKEINDRRQNGQDFNGNDLSNIASQSIHGLNHLHNLEISHGDIRPMNIGFNKDTQEVQILDRLNDPSPLEKLQTNNIVNKKDLYVSPEVYRKILGKDKTLKYNPFKNDLYGLGLSLLAAGNQNSIQNIYKPNGDFSQDELDKHLAQFDAKYSVTNPDLSNTMHNLLNNDESQRYTAQEWITYQSRLHDTEVHVEQPVQEYTQEPQVEERKSQKHIYYHGNNTTEYVYTQPTTTYVQAEPEYRYATPTQTQTFSYSSPKTNYVQSTMNETNTSSLYENPEGRLVTVQRLDGTTYSYYTKVPIDQSDTVHTYEQNDPRNPSGSQKQVTVQSTPDQMMSTPISYTVQSTPQTYTQVQNTPTEYYYTQDQQEETPTRRTYVYSNPDSYNQVQSQVVYSQQQPTVVRTSHVVQNSPVTYQAGTYYQPNVVYTTPAENKSEDVEVRRGSSVPTENQTTEVVTKYVVEGEKVIKVEDH